MLTGEQEKYIRNSHKKKSAKNITKHLGLKLADVTEFIASLKSVEEKKRELVFRYVTIAVPFLIFILLEAGLRIGHFGVDTSLFQERIVGGKVYYDLNDEVSLKYFQINQAEKSVSLDAFPKVKAPNAYRIFVLGESSTIGYPYMVNGAFSAMLKDRLQNLLPDKKIEMVNCGMTAISSFVVLDFVKQILDYQPDLLLVYTGHNEFYGSFAVGSAEYLGKNRSVIKTYLYLEQFKTFVLLQHAVAWGASLFGKEGEGAHNGTLMEAMVRNRGIAYGSSDYITARENFKANLEEIISLAKSHQTNIILGTLASNWRGVPPFVSLFSPGTSKEDQARFESLYASAVQAIGSGMYANALDTLKRCDAIDSLQAKAQFMLGKCLEQFGEYGKAKAAYIRARDFDGLHFRAPSDFNSVIVDLCKQENIPLAQSEQMVADRCAHGIIGPEMMLEHVHLNVDGYFTIAKAFYEAIKDNNLIEPKDRWDWKNDKTDEEYRVMAGVTEFDSVAAVIKMYILTNSWPFTDHSVTLESYPAHTELEKHVKQYLLSGEGWEQGHTGIADYYASINRFDKAADEYLALLKATPENVSPYLALGQTLFTMKDTSAAESVYIRSVDVEGTFTAHNMLGIINFRRANYAEAATQFEEALKITEDAPPMLYKQAERLLGASKRKIGM